MNLSWIEKLKAYEWQWIVVIYLSEGTGQSKANRLFLKWIAKLEEIEGHPVSWTRLDKRDLEAGTIYFRVLIGGLRCATRRRISANWNRKTGTISLQLFRTNRWGIREALMPWEYATEAEFRYDLHKEHLRRERNSGRPFRSFGETLWTRLKTSQHK